MCPLIPPSRPTETWLDAGGGLWTAHPAPGAVSASRLISTRLRPGASWARKKNEKPSQSCLDGVGRTLQSAPHERCPVASAHALAHLPSAGQPHPPADARSAAPAPQPNGLRCRPATEVVPAGG